MRAIASIAAAVLSLSFVSGATASSHTATQAQTAPVVALQQQTPAVGAHSTAKATSGSILQISPDASVVMIQKDYGSERWSITLNQNTGVYSGNVFKTDGRPASFVWCPKTSSTDQDITFSCQGADACRDSTCPGVRDDGRPDWVFIGDQTLPRSFFEPRAASALESENAKVNAVQEGVSAEGSGSILQNAPDTGVVLIQKDYGNERWSISYDPDTGVYLGNVYKTDGSPPSFIWCSTTSATNSEITFSCSGADACIDSSCPGYRADGRPDWVFIGDQTLPRSFFQPRPVSTSSETFSSGGVQITASTETLGDSKLVRVTSESGQPLVVIRATTIGVHIEVPGQSGATDVPLERTLSELPADFAMRRLGAFIGGQLARSQGRLASTTDLATVLDSPGCDFFPDTQCTLGCCAVHDRCYFDNGCTASSWVPGLGSEACTSCNATAAGCILSGCTGGDIPGGDRCYDYQCDQSYDCGAANCDCSSPCQCGNGSLDSDEVCDGSNFGGKTCETEDPGSQGNLKCEPGCKSIDTSGCSTGICPSTLFESLCNNLSTSAVCQCFTEGPQSSADCASCDGVAENCRDNPQPSCDACLQWSSCRSSTLGCDYFTYTIYQADVPPTNVGCLFP